MMKDSSKQGTAPHVPGPYIVPIDYEALYQMEEPPGYEPWDV